MTTPTRYIVLVCGGRSFGNLLSYIHYQHLPIFQEKKLEYQYIFEQLDKLAATRWPRLEEDIDGNWLPNVYIIAGAADGVDTAAIDWAVTNWNSYKEFPADWNKHGKAAGPIRNRQMLDEGKPNEVVAFPGGTGTEDMVRQSRKAGVPVTQFFYDDFLHWKNTVEK